MTHGPVKHFHARKRKDEGERLGGPDLQHDEDRRQNDHRQIQKRRFSGPGCI